MSEWVLPEAEDDSDRKLLNDIWQHGWHLVGITKEADAREYTFSVGLIYTLNHPEIVIMGLKASIAGHLINSMGEAIRNGTIYEIGQNYDGIAEGFPLQFVPVERALYRKYLGYILWTYRTFEIPVLQCVWPDPQGKFPWDEGYDERFATLQPLLNRME